ncbi:MAG: hypothetical protein ACYSU0_03035 [Planctomycetota bacterium]
MSGSTAIIVSISPESSSLTSFAYLLDELEAAHQARRGPFLLAYGLGQGKHLVGGERPLLHKQDFQRLVEALLARMKRSWPQWSREAPGCSGATSATAC